MDEGTIRRFSHDALVRARRSRGAERNCDVSAEPNIRIGETTHQRGHLISQFSYLAIEFGALQFDGVRPSVGPRDSAQGRQRAQFLN